LTSAARDISASPMNVPATLVSIDDGGYSRILGR
jgi:hypothetical protein